jgi:VWFA-related protein
MRRIPLAVLALLLGLLLVFALLFQVGSTQALPGADGQVRVTQVDTSAYPQVSLYTAVGDSAGGLRTDLSRSDFQIIEDGTPVELTGFVGAGGSAISTALVIDRSGSMQDADKIAGARDAADAFVDLLRPGDHAALISFNSDVRVSEPFTADHAALQSAIDRLRPDGGTALYDSIVAGVDLLRGQPGRRVLLVLTDGQDCREPGLCPAESGSSHSLRDAISYATAAGQAVYVVGLGERGSSGDSGIDEGVLRRIASETDGVYYYSPDASALANLYTSLAGNLQREYRITYVSPRPFYDGTRRDIRVTVAGVSVGAGYTERHLINVTSGPLVGAALLLPLLGLLFLPGVVASRRRAHDGVLAESPAAAAALASGPPVIVVAPVAAPEPVTAGQCCASCAAPLRPGARFCGRCGVTQPAPPAAGERRTFCDMCGRPLPSDASFCTACGEPVTLRAGGNLEDMLRG